MNVLLIGAGFWGQKILSVLDRMNKFNIFIYDEDKEKAKNIKLNNATFVSNLDKALKNHCITHVFIATPPKTHFDLSLRALSNYKHVFVEKPITLSSCDAEILLNTSIKNKVTLHTDNTFIYTPEINFLKTIIDFDFIGKISCFESNRSNWGPFNDIDVVWDLMTHDVSILKYILPSNYNLIGVSATGCSQVNLKYIEKAKATLYYNNNFTAYIEASFLNHYKTRKITLNGSSGIFHHDSAIKDSCFTITRTEGASQEYTPQGLIDPLYLEINHFFECSFQNKITLSSGEEGFYTIKVLEKIMESIQNNGKFIPIHTE